MSENQSIVLPFLKQKLNIADSSRTLILLMGSNPLPSVLAALAYGAGTTAHFIYTGEVADRMERAKNLLSKRGIIVGNSVSLSSSSNPRLIREELSTFLKEHPADLFYSGGTKVMAVHAYQLWHQAKSQVHSGKTLLASSLAADGRLHFDDCLDPCDLRFSPRLSLEELHSLHEQRLLEGTKLHSTDLSHPAHPTAIETARKGLADKIATLCRSDKVYYFETLMPNLYGQRSKEIMVELQPDPKSKAKNTDGAEEPSKSVLPTLNCESLSLGDAENFIDKGPLTEAYALLAKKLLTGSNESREASLDTLTCQYYGVNELPTRCGDRKKRRLKTAKFLYGDWLEIWLAHWISTVKDRQDPSRSLFDEVYQDVTLGKGADVQLDVVAMRGARVFLFSCTVDSTKSLVKSKLMEARMRAEQLGGDLARYSVVSFSRTPDCILNEVKADGFAGYNDAQVFGLSDFQNLPTLEEKLCTWVHA